MAEEKAEEKVSDTVLVDSPLAVLNAACVPFGASRPDYSVDSSIQQLDSTPYSSKATCLHVCSSFCR